LAGSRQADEARPPSGELLWRECAGFGQGERAGWRERRDRRRRQRGSVDLVRLPAPEQPRSWDGPCQRQYSPHRPRRRANERRWTPGVRLSAVSGLRSRCFSAIGRVARNASQLTLGAGNPSRSWHACL
jgi:hypothetical protein